MSSGVQRICGCGHRVPKSVRCLCEARRDAERKARFDRTRPSSSGRGYTGAWDRARAEHLAAHPWCKRCGERAQVVDHKIPHRGDQKLFWDRKNWQNLCTPCHSGAKQREERGVDPHLSPCFDDYVAANPTCWCGKPTFTVVGARPLGTRNKSQWRPLCRSCASYHIGA